jgi:hypothetical protein
MRHKVGSEVIVLAPWPLERPGDGWIGHPQKSRLGLRNPHLRHQSHPKKESRFGNCSATAPRTQLLHGVVATRRFWSRLIRTLLSSAGYLHLNPVTVRTHSQKQDRDSQPASFKNPQGFVNKPPQQKGIPLLWVSTQCFALAQR